MSKLTKPSLDCYNCDEEMTELKGRPWVEKLACTNCGWLVERCSQDLMSGGMCGPIDRVYDKDENLIFEHGFGCR